mmetsp:Transcript_20796/g.34276  ORF Transcript_20796/g.34276 Transcript_20796/m.34276 type:complete len:104 (-) Transcript_20796:70-381(-)
MEQCVPTREWQDSLRRPPVGDVDSSSVLDPVVAQRDHDGDPRVAVIVHRMRLPLPASVTPDQRVAWGAGSTIALRACFRVLLPHEGGYACLEDGRHESLQPFS